ncbi:MAG TPA: hypothetical protein DCZ94_00770 [Lentisphaeria bacterium]|nr:MAG: hypothetical protein A2X48_12335 [Lentisphaerae bacterium GWF2_49_21]HBC85463.1 hypothetical protein [Lentisphaeria bacterium]
MNKKIILYFFSGTGNTLWASRQFAEEMQKHGIETRLVPLPCAVPDNLEDDSTIAIAFPVYSSTAPPFVCDWIRSLPETKKTVPVVLISTLAGFSGLVKGPFYHILKKKGYMPLAVREFIMPPNYFHKYNDARNFQIMERAKSAAADFAKEISEGKSQWPASPSFLNPLQLVAEKFFKHGGTGFLGKGFHADKGKCTKCGFCIRLCPVDNINSTTDGYPAWTGKCQQCLRCITYCPADAISNRRMKLVLYPGYKCPEISPDDLLPAKSKEQP